MIQGDLRMFVGAKAVGFSGRDSRLVVESLGGAVSEAAFGDKPVEQLASVLSERACELLEGGQSRAHGHGVPAVEEAPGPEVGGVGPEVLEVLFEKIGSDRAQVEGDQLAEPDLLGAPEVFRFFKQEPPGLGEDGMASGRSQEAKLLTTN